MSIFVPGTRHVGRYEPGQNQLDRPRCPGVRPAENGTSSEWGGRSNVKRRRGNAGGEEGPRRKDRSHGVGMMAKFSTLQSSFAIGGRRAFPANGGRVGTSASVARSRHGGRVMTWVAFNQPRSAQSRTMGPATGGRRGARGRSPLWLPGPPQICPAGANQGPQPAALMTGHIHYRSSRSLVCPATSRWARRARPL